MSDATYTDPMCTHWSCVCVYFGVRTRPGASPLQTRNGRYSRLGRRLHFHHGSGLLSLSLCCCIVCIHYNYIHTYIRETYSVCNRSVHNENTGGVAA